ncbi:MAG: efflux RND transporter permease subunit, partial [Bryobacteraceae bacterium]
MSSFAIRNPYFIVVICLIVLILGGVAVATLPVDLFPRINIPVVVVATFYSGMPPQEIEAGISSRLERYFTLADGIEHIESRSLAGVSIVRLYFQPGTNADSAASNVANIAMSNLRKLPQGTLPPVVMKFDASSLPVCLVTAKGEGLSEATIRDIVAVPVRNQVAGVAGASMAQPFGGRVRQVMVYAQPEKLEAFKLSPMDVVRAINNSNVVLPAGDVRIGPVDYNLYSNSMIEEVPDINQVPIKRSGSALVTIGDIGHAVDGEALQYNVVRIDGQRSVYFPVLKLGGDANTIAVVDGVRERLKGLVDVPKELKTGVVFDQSLFVKSSIETLLHEGGIGLVLTSVMVLLFLGSFRATIAVCLSIPLSALGTFLVLWLGGNTINTMVLGGLALAFSRIIDNSVIVLENVYRHLEMGATSVVAAEKGGHEVTLPVLSATLTTVVVFFPVVLLYGVSKFLFTAMALAVSIALFVSYAVALTVVPVFAARYIHPHAGHSNKVHAIFQHGLNKVLNAYERMARAALRAPGTVLIATLALSAATLVVWPRIGQSFFPRTDAAQFVANVKAPTGTRIEDTEKKIARVEDIIRKIVDPKDLDVIVSNIGVTPGMSSIYSQSTGQHSSVVQAAFKEDHKIGSYEYMRRVRKALSEQLPEVTTFFQSGGLVDSVLNMGVAAPIDIQISSSDIRGAHRVAADIASHVRDLREVEQVFIPQDVDSPVLRLNVNRTRASAAGLEQREVVSNVITALTSNQMIAPGFWVDPKSGRDYLLTVQYPENQVRNTLDLRSIPLHAPGTMEPTRLDTIA